MEEMNAQILVVVSTLTTTLTTDYSCRKYLGFHPQGFKVPNQTLLFSGKSMTLLFYEDQDPVMAMPCLQHINQ